MKHAVAGPDSLATYKGNKQRKVIVPCSRQQMCDKVMPYIKNQEIEAVQVESLPAYEPSMTYDFIESTYKIHKQAFVKIDIDHLEVFEYFRCLRLDSDDYYRLLASFDV